MRFLADENFPGNSVRLLQQHGLDVSQVAAHEQGSPDEWILRTTVTQERTVLTFDRDFGDLVTITDTSRRLRALFSSEPKYLRPPNCLSGCCG